MKYIGREEIGLVLLSISTFLIVLPILCSTWRYSVYYQGESFQPDDSSTNYNLTTLSDSNAGQKVFLLVTIVTVRREGHLYLTRVVDRLHQLLSGHENVRVLICNVDPYPELHREAVQLEMIYPSVRRGESSNNLFNKEKEDYVFCLNASISKADYVLVLEDDAVPLDDFLPVTSHLINYFSDHHPNFFYIKLYHPERLQGYLQPEPWRIAEWLAGSVLAVFVLSFCFHLRRYFAWLLYFMALMECMGRPHLIQLRRYIGPAGYNLLAATECCTPAMLFSSSSASTAATFLSSVTCRKGFAKDAALYQHVRQSQGRLQAFVVEPNLVQHIGRVSTLRFKFPIKTPQLTIERDAAVVVNGD